MSYREPGKRDESYESEKDQRVAQLKEFLDLCLIQSANHGNSTVPHIVEYYR